ncbi:MAG: hypothetical protein A3K19_00090 [Lentisphaerae bacterium RIFOXYB12_FULL_65_16]|nr:MAG: hypothetical protein A3K18_06730 [Lentisphaerae bacterium RIFOXYA12_64_32]OGV86205.1 MAG: hypothetical protein A3K19_00090 [Lentisphaerae bacterium RIFOXYB12_FULL_65_16]
MQEGDRTTPVSSAVLPVVVVLDSLRSAFNVGNIFRLAEATRVERIVTCGCTATPPHPKLAKTARGCDASVPCRHVDTAAVALDELHQQGYAVYGVETAATAEVIWKAAWRLPAAIVFGNEALGISHEALARCDGFVRLPCFGTKNSINVGNCAAVVLYQVLGQWLAGREV